MNETLAKLLRKLYGIAETGATAYAGTQQPYTAEQAKGMLSTMADFTPVVGDVKSAYEGIQAAREGDYVGAGLGALGALPMVPNMAGSIGKSISPEILKAIGNEEPAVLASKIKGLLSVQLNRQRSLSERIKSASNEMDSLALNTELMKTDSNVKKLHGWLMEVEPPINHSNPF